MLGSVNVCGMSRNSSERNCRPVLCFEFPEAPRILTQHRFADLSGGTLKIVLHNAYCSTIRTSHQAHRPVGANHESRSPESFKSDIEVRSKVLRLPSLPVGFGDQSRELAEHVRKYCQTPNSSGP